MFVNLHVIHNMLISVTHASNFVRSFSYLSLVGILKQYVIQPDIKNHVVQDNLSALSQMDILYNMIDIHTIFQFLYQRCTTR